MTVNNIMCNFKLNGFPLVTLFSLLFNTLKSKETKILKILKISNFKNKKNREEKIENLEIVTY